MNYMYVIVHVCYLLLISWAPYSPLGMKSGAGLMKEDGWYRENENKLHDATIPLYRYQSVVIVFVCVVFVC